MYVVVNACRLLNSFLIKSSEERTEIEFLIIIIYNVPVLETKEVNFHHKLRDLPAFGGETEL